MTYKITSVTTKPNLSVPNFDTWLSTVPASAIAQFPDAAGKTPVQVIEDSVKKLKNPAAGFISEGGSHSNDQLVWTWESVWESKEDWSAAIASITYIDGQADEGELAAGYIRKLYLTENNITVENFETFTDSEEASPTEGQ